MKYQKGIQLLAFMVFGISMGKSQAVFNIATGTNITVPMGSNNDYENKEYAIKPGFNISCLLIGGNDPKLNFGMEILYVENTYLDQSIFGHNSPSETKNTVSHLNFSFYGSTTPTIMQPISFSLGPTFGFPISQSIAGKKVEKSEANIDLRATGKILIEFPLRKKIRFTIDNTFSLGLVQPEHARKIDQRFFYYSLQAGVMFVMNRKEHH